MPQQTQAVPVLETGGDLNILNQQELHVYSRKQNSQNKLLMNSMHCPESELVLGTNSSSSGNPKNISETLDVPIAHRKGVRSCTKHPISKFVSYDNLFPSFHAFTTNLSSVNIPSKSVVRCQWIFAIKFKPDGLIERYKAWLVAKGFTQTYGVDYTKTFAPMAKLNTIHLGVGRFLGWGAMNAKRAASGVVVIWDNKVLDVVGVYEPTLKRYREFFWEELRVIRGLQTDSWCNGGDFNVIRFPSERSREGRMSTSMRRFSEVIDELTLRDLLRQGGGPLLGVEG
ncbi:Retrovirus-related Pol polyprotein from transposon RE2 [Vitis vinifera]|uniref:Retrovirus-related Pol polyprotein from transposon RE2 n=1 Tax=Vitis vinifera TaxID=29760 RepID=A0A438DL27_VITVI|nr:Retrovirus-related Pol polyprotein from transposon RE2 [Vitis vinifera]